MKFLEKLKACMPASYVFQKKLREIDEMQEKIRSTRPPDTQEARDNGDFYDYYCAVSDAHQERRVLITNNYRRLIEGLSMPMPDSADTKLWEKVESGLTQQSEWCLTQAGEHAAIAVIREAKKYRREALTAWCTALTGLGGVVIGVLSMLKVFG